MKRIAKALLPDRLITYVRTRRRSVARRSFFDSWDKAAKRTGEASRGDALLILPSDPLAIIGAVGDDAMISSTIAHYGALGTRVAMLCDRGEPEIIVRSYGWEPVIMPDLASFPEAMAMQFASGRFGAFVGVGADVMDGYYSPDFTAQILAAADLAARAGLQSTILGFSFNAAAHPSLKAAFERIDPRVAVNVRDKISLERLKKFAPTRARLVADSAFMLQPGTLDVATAEWIAGEREAGRRVIGLNLHPMLNRESDPTLVRQMVRTVADAVQSADALAEPPVSWIMIPHDYRDAAGIGDGVCLRPLMEELSRDVKLRCRYFGGTHRASTLKALAGRLDGVVTGRMHLAIAALGMGVPVMCLTYQDKFEGLFEHFQLPKTLLVPPPMPEGRALLTETLEYFLAQLPELARRVGRQKSHVLEMSAMNFAPGGGAEN